MCNFITCLDRTSWAKHSILIENGANTGAPEEGTILLATPYVLNSEPCMGASQDHGSSFGVGLVSM